MLLRLLLVLLVESRVLSKEDAGNDASDKDDFTWTIIIGNVLFVSKWLLYSLFIMSSPTSSLFSCYLKTALLAASIQLHTKLLQYPRRDHRDIDVQRLSLDEELFALVVLLGLFSE